MDRFDTDVMDDLMSEGPTSMMDDYDEYQDAADDDMYDDWDAGEEDDFAVGVATSTSGSASFDDYAGFDEYDEFEDAEGFDEGDEFEDEFDEGDDAMEEAVAEAMDADDSDEFFRRLGRIARSVGRGIGSVARTVAPIASMLPIPQAQLIGRIANVAGRLLADGADELEAFDDLVDGLDEDGIDAAAPVLAGMLVRRALPSVARAAPNVRRAAVRTVTRAVRTAARRQGPRAARAVGRAVVVSRRVAQRRRLPARQAVRVVRRVTSQVTRRPQALRRLARPLVPPARRAIPRAQGVRIVGRTVAPVARRAAATVRRGGGACPNCRAARRIVARGPVVLNVRCRS
jgi:hypothetical protein